MVKTLRNLIGLLKLEDLDSNKMEKADKRLTLLRYKLVAIILFRK